MAERSVSKVFLIAKREFRHTVLTKSFLLGAIALPAILFALMAVVPMLLVSQLEQLKGEFALVDPTGSVPAALEEIIESRQSGESNLDLEETLRDAGMGDLSFLSALGSSPEEMLSTDAFIPDLNVRWVKNTDEIDALKAEARKGELAGLAVIPTSLLNDSVEPDKDHPTPRVELVIPNNTSPRHASELRSLVREAVVRARFERAGADLASVQTMLREPSVDLKRLGEEGREHEENVALRSIIPMVFMLLIWIATFTSGNYLLTSTIEEKSNKVMEVVLSAVSPLQLLWGKIIGLAAVALIILFMYGGLAIAALVFFAMTDLLSWYMLLWSAYFFLVAYFMVASLMAAVGSAVSDLREAQSLIGPVMIVLMVPFVLWMPISDNPNGAVAVVCSFLPPIQPFAMVMRLAASTEPIPTWELWLGAGIGAASVFGFVWAAARIFRVGVLMQGKPPSPIELVRWIRRA